MIINIAHAGLDIIKSSDPLYKQEMKELDFESLKNKNNGSQQQPPGGGPGKATETDPLVVLKHLFKTKEFAFKILDKNHIANKYRQKYIEDVKKE